MSENNHTPEPYSVFTVYAHPEIRDSNGDFVAALGAGDVVRARRFVACANACTGTSDDDLAEIQHYGGVERVFEFWKQAEKQRDELLSDLAEAKRSAEFNFEQYQDVGRLLHEECEKTEKLLAALGVAQATINCAGISTPKIVRDTVEKYAEAIASVKGGE